MKEFFSHIKNGIILLLIIMIGILLLKECGRKVIDPVGNITGPEVISTKTTKDSVRVEYVEVVKWDTLVKYYPKKVYVYPETTLDSSAYCYNRKDSLANITACVYASEKPDSVSIDYDLKEIIKTDSIYVRDSITVETIQKVRVNQIYLGPELIIYPGFNGGFVTLDFVSKKGFQLELGAGYAQVNGQGGLMGKLSYKPLISFRKRK